jgi:UDP-glucuronate decarboxylase
MSSKRRKQRFGWTFWDGSGTLAPGAGCSADTHWCAKSSVWDNSIAWGCVESFRERERMRGSAVNALVTGGAGFIGSNLCRRLLGEGAHVTCVDSLLTGRIENLWDCTPSDRFQFIEHDVIDPLPPRIRGARFTHIYHLACAASPPHYQADPEHTMLTNVVGTRNLLRLAEESGARLLLTSTSEVYGDPEVHPQTEDYRGNVSCTGPRACYDEGKRVAETLMSDYHRQAKVDIRIARIFNTYGPRMAENDGRVVSNFILQALRGEPITLYGTGEQTRSFCYVDDLVDGLIRLMDADGITDPVNLGNPGEFTMRQLAEMVCRLCGSSSDIVMRPLPQDDPTRRRPDISRARALLGWQPHIPLEEGLTRTIADFTARLEARSQCGTGGEG